MSPDADGIEDAAVVYASRQQTQSRKSDAKRKAASNGSHATNTSAATHTSAATNVSPARAGASNVIYASNVSPFRNVDASPAMAQRACNDSVNAPSSPPLYPPHSILKCKDVSSPISRGDMAWAPPSSHLQTRSTSRGDRDEEVQECEDQEEEDETALVLEESHFGGSIVSRRASLRSPNASKLFYV